VADASDEDDDIAASDRDSESDSDGASRAAGLGRAVSRRASFAMMTVLP
jgi:hypothetical protein